MKGSHTYAHVIAIAFSLYRNVLDDELRMPVEVRKSLSNPWPPKIVRQAKIRTRMLDHSGITTARNSSVRHFGGATRAMNHASGSASAMSTSVTIVASRIVRQ